MKKNIIKYGLFIYPLVFISCHRPKQNDVKQQKTMAFRHFLKGFKILAPPLTITPNYLLDGKSFDDLPNFLQIPSDTMFADTSYLHMGIFQDAKRFIILADTTNYFNAIWLGLEDYYYPVLTTYSKSGEVISTNQINIGRCGEDADTCLDCSETLIISKDYSVYSSDTLIEYPCDSNESRIAGKKHIEVFYIKGKIPHNSPPKFSKEQEKKIE